MAKFDFNQGVVTVVIGGMIVFFTLEVCLLIAGFNEHEIGRVWGGLAILWVPGFFIWGGRTSQNDDPL